jgi:hypothetical protein
MVSRWRMACASRTIEFSNENESDRLGHRKSARQEGPTWGTVH